MNKKYLLLMLIGATAFASTGKVNVGMKPHFNYTFGSPVIDKVDSAKPVDYVDKFGNTIKSVNQVPTVTYKKGDNVLDKKYVLPYSFEINYDKGISFGVKDGKYNDNTGIGSFDPLKNTANIWGSYKFNITPNQNGTLKVQNYVNVESSTKGNIGTEFSFAYGYNNSILNYTGTLGYKGNELIFAPNKVYLNNAFKIKDNYTVNLNLSQQFSGVDAYAITSANYLFLGGVGVKEPSTKTNVDLNAEVNVFGFSIKPGYELGVTYGSIDVIGNKNPDFVDTKAESITNLKYFSIVNPNYISSLPITPTNLYYLPADSIVAKPDLKNPKYDSSQPESAKNPKIFEFVTKKSLYLTNNIKLDLGYSNDFGGLVNLDLSIKNKYSFDLFNGKFVKKVSKANTNSLWETLKYVSGVDATGNPLYNNVIDKATNKPVTTKLDATVSQMYTLNPSVSVSKDFDLDPLTLTPKLGLEDTLTVSFAQWYDPFHKEGTTPKPQYVSKVLLNNVFNIKPSLVATFKVSDPVKLTLGVETNIQLNNTKLNNIDTSLNLGFNYSW